MQFCLTLLITGNFNAYSLFQTIIDDIAALKNVVFPNEIKQIFNPSNLESVLSTPSLPAKLCLRKFSVNQRMNEKRKQFLQNFINLMEKVLILDPVLWYLKFYEVFSDEHITSIKVLFYGLYFKVYYFGFVFRGQHRKISSNVLFSI